MRKHILSRVLSLLLCLCLSLTLFGCKSISAGPDASSSRPEPGVSTAASAATQPADTTAKPSSAALPLYAQPVDFVWQPYVMSDIFAALYGDDFVASFHSMADAFLAYEPTFACSSADQADQINTAASNCFPLLRMDVPGVRYDEVQGKGVLDYSMTKQEHMDGIRNFTDSVTQFIESCVMKSDNTTTQAMAMYMAYSARITYDFAATDVYSTADLSSYRGLTEFAGICQTFGPAYAYLCLEMGIDAINAGGLSTDNSAHDWTLVRLDGAYYYMDTTWENGDGGYGLKYFGMTTADRAAAGQYTEKFINIENTNEVWGPDVDVSSGRFASLRGAVYASFNTERTQVDCTDIDGNTSSFFLN